MGERGDQANPEIYKRVREFFPRERRVAIDCGAYTGEWSRMLAADFYEVYAFEVRPDNRALLRQNTPMNVVIPAVGLGARHEAATFRVRFGKYAQVARADHDRENSPTMTYHVVPLDSLHLVGVDFIKIDVDGSEEAVLLGALNTIDRCRPVIVIETKLMPVEKQREMLNLVGYADAGKVSLIDNVWIPE